MNDDDVIQESSCPECGATVAVDQGFCEECGARVAAARPRRRGAGAMGRHARSAHSKNINAARLAILIVGILQTLVAALGWWGYSELASLHRLHPELDLDALVSQVRLVLFVATVVGITYVGLSVMVSWNPLAACVTALVLFGTNLLIRIVVEPIALVNPLFLGINVLILVVLAFGAKSALAFHRARAAGATNRIETVLAPQSSRRAGRAAPQRSRRRRR